MFQRRFNLRSEIWQLVSLRYQPSEVLQSLPAPAQLAVGVAGVEAFHGAYRGDAFEG